ncbi:Phosphoesterase [Flavobacterium daejeonense]|nr:Phosphoesterase [Flavobacterium daejeonense]
MNSKKRNKRYQHFAIALLFLAPLTLLPKGFIETKYNLFEYPELFSLFRYSTLLGDGWMLLAVLVFILVRLHFYTNRKKLKELYSFIFAAALMSLTVCLLKNIIFHNELRPIACLSLQNAHWDTTQFNIHFNRLHSFPSGHTATFACIGFFLMRFIKKTFYIRLLFIGILFVGFSRMFLFQHFVLDVFIGFYIGLFSVITADKITALILNKRKNPKTVLVLNNSL